MRSIRAFLLMARQKLAFVRDSKKKAHSSATALQGFFFGLLSNEDQAERSEA
jgi:hypothetical protein